jgi:hypothetical protein
MHDKNLRCIALLVAASVLSATTFAGPPPWAGGGHKGEEEHGHKGKHEEVYQERAVVRQGAYFSSHQREAVHSYYASHGCPPGLAKKHNGCMPPGQAKKVWRVGEPLPPTVVLAPVPQQIIVTLPPAPTGHRYVEVAGDILLIAAGSKMVVDGINGLAGR